MSGDTTEQRTRAIIREELRGELAAFLGDKLDRLLALAARAEPAPLLATSEAARLVGRSPAGLRMLATRRADVAAARVGHGRASRWDRTRLLAALGVDRKPEARR